MSSASNTPLTYLPLLILEILIQVKNASQLINFNVLHGILWGDIIQSSLREQSRMTKLGSGMGVLDWQCVGSGAD